MDFINGASSTMKSAASKTAADDHCAEDSSRSREREKGMDSHLVRDKRCACFVCVRVYIIYI